MPEFEKRWNRYARKAGQSWRVDETEVKIHGRWVYLYRAVDREGNTVDFRLGPKRDVAAVKGFLRKAIKTQGRAPTSVTLDGDAASHRAVRDMPAENRVWKNTKLRSSKYLNNMIEQDHRGVESRIGPMLGFKDFERAAVTISGIELLHRIRKGQYAFAHSRQNHVCHLECSALHLKFSGMMKMVRQNAAICTRAARHTSTEFVAFLSDIVANQPRGKEIHVIADNLSAHKTKRVDEFLAEHSNVHMHFTPTYSSWLNQVELWFAKIERDVIARGVFTSLTDLKRKLMRYIRQYNKQPKPVKWKYFDSTKRIAPESIVTGH